MMPRFVYVAAAIITTVRALRQTNAARLTLFGDGCGFRAARLDDRMRGHPAVVAAARRGRLDPTLRFIREVLGVEDATDLIEATPQLASTPLAVLAARHAYLRRVGAPRGAQLATPGLRPPLLGDLCATPASHEDFAEACGGDESDVAALVAAFRRGGRRAAADGDALLVRDLLAHGWAPSQDRDRRGASAAHVAAHIRVAPAPKAGQIPRSLQRAACGGQQFNNDRQPVVQHGWPGFAPEHLLQFHRQHHLVLVIPQGGFTA